MRALAIVVGSMVAQIAGHEIEDGINVVIGGAKVVFRLVQTCMMFVGRPSGNE